MLFNSPEFIFLFLPLTLAGFILLGRVGRHRTILQFLLLASLFFYGWWYPPYLLLLLGSILVNFALGQQISRRVRAGDRSRGPLIAGVVINLGLLGLFKYAGFLGENLSYLGLPVSLPRFVLPLGISFYTFQQIAYLVDCREGSVDRSDPVEYGLFVTFFPQLIAGPIVHHATIIPQLRDPSCLGIRPERFAAGVALFSLGLGKKVLLADTFAPFANDVFQAAQRVDVTLLEAWLGTLAYALQIYFDFSGYSDMAIGLGWLFGIDIPRNFNSPYKAIDIIDFWRRWHITLSEFLRNYLYIPLGGNRHGRVRRYANLMVTMLLGGLWHGAGWTFVIWGGLHGAYLTINHAWRARPWRPKVEPTSRVRVTLARLLTFGAVCLAWVFFRAADMSSALRMVSGMLGLSGVSLPEVMARLGGAIEPLKVLGCRLEGLGSFKDVGVVYVILGLGIAWSLRSAHDMVENPTPRSTWLLGILAGLALFFSIRTFITGAPSEFIYFNF